MRDQILDALAGYDVLLGPAMPTGAPPRAESRHTAGKEQVIEALTGASRMTAPFNHAGVPALSVPCGFTSDGLPIGLQVVGRPFEDSAVLRVGRAYERAIPWHTRRPPTL